MSELVSPLNLPTSMEIVGDTAYVVTLTGEVWEIALPDSLPFGVR